MINSYMEACQALGMRPGATREQWKTAYRNICKMYHPDNYSGEDGIIILQNACDAYEFLEKQYMLMMNTKPRVIGTPVRKSPVDNHNNREYLKELEKKKKQARQKELEERAKKIKEQQQKEKQEKLLDEIRWIRVSEIIRNTIREDIARKDLEKKMYDAIKNAQDKR